jgi:hypothetical protein
MAESILHFAAMTLRVTGSGSLRMTLYSLDDARTVTLLPLTMSNTSGREPTRRVNFVEQRARFKMYVNAIDENFRINRVVIWVKEKATSFPM